MKIKEFSESRKLSNQAIYKGINRAGYSVKQITNKNGDITQQGMKILKKLFPENLYQDLEPGAENRQPGQPGSATTTNYQDTETTAARHSAENQEIEQLREKIKDLEILCNEWKTKCTDWEERYFELEQTKAREAQEMRSLLLHEQQLRMSVERKGFFKRLFSGKQEKE